MKRFPSTQRRVRVDRLIDLGERVPEAERIAGGELLMRGLAPFEEDVRDLGGRDRRTVHRPDDDVMGAGVVDAFCLVGTDPLIEPPELVPQLADGTGRQVPEVTFGKPGVFAADFHFSAEAEIIANKDPCPCYKPGRVGHIVAIPNSNDPAEVCFCTARESDGHNPEVSGSLVAERVGFLGDREPT